MLCGGLAAILGAASARAADAALIAAAQKEGQVTWYTTQITNQFGRPTMDAFQKRYEGQTLFRDADYIPAAPDVPPREPALRPDGKSFRGIFFSPEETDASMPHWLDVYNEIFR
jgi:hypothetical protein